jgi:hypothetical protein
MVVCGSVMCERISACEQVAEHSGKKHEDGNKRKFVQGYIKTIFTYFEHFTLRQNRPRMLKVEVKQSHYRPGQALSVPGG